MDKVVNSSSEGQEVCFWCWVGIVWRESPLGWMGKRCSCTTSHEASRKTIHQPWPLFFLSETEEMTTEVQRWAHAGGRRKDALAWSFPGGIGTNVCSSQIGSRWHVTFTSSSKSSLGKQWIYWAPLKSTGEGLLPGAWVTPKLLHHHQVPSHHGWWFHGSCTMELTLLRLLCSPASS